MSDDNKAVMRRLFQMINSGDLTGLGEILAPDGIEHQEFPGISGSMADQFRQFVHIFRTAFPDFHCTLDDVIAEGDRVVVRGVFSGTHRGEFMGIPATGKSFSVAAYDLARFRDGQVIEHWGLADTAAMMAQLGLVPPSH